MLFMFKFYRILGECERPSPDNHMSFFISLIFSLVILLSIPGDLLLSPTVGGGKAVRKQNSLVRCPCGTNLITALTFRVLLNIGRSQSSPEGHFSQGPSCGRQLSIPISDVLNTNNLLSY